MPRKSLYLGEAPLLDCCGRWSYLVGLNLTHRAPLGVQGGRGSMSSEPWNKSPSGYATEVVFFNALLQINRVGGG